MSTKYAETRRNNSDLVSNMQCNNSTILQHHHHGKHHAILTSRRLDLPQLPSHHQTIQTTAQHREYCTFSSATSTTICRLHQTPLPQPHCRLRPRRRPLPPRHLHIRRSQNTYITPRLLFCILDRPRPCAIRHLHLSHITLQHLPHHATSTNP